MNIPRIELAHGGGGRLTRDLIREEVVSRFGESLQGLPDAATLDVPPGGIVFTTDSYVVQPLEFPGGNIGHLAVHGTVNDLAVSGGKPMWLSLGLILEEGLPMEVFRRILDAVRSSANECGVTVVTGDTKVIPRGLCDGLYANTAGIGLRMPGFSLGADRLRRGDSLLVSGPVADHGFAVLAARANIALRNGPRSDTAPVHRLVQACAPMASAVRFMRDPTRGGLATVLNELIDERHLGIRLDEQALPVSAGARAVSELLGLDPLHVASEGRMVLVCAPEAEAAILKAWRAMPEGSGAARIGEISDDAGRVILDTLTGGRRLVDVPRGELLPRIC
jgi:hydrogenase expression/formation protein HypE